MKTAKSHKLHAVAPSSQFSAPPRPERVSVSLESLLAMFSDDVGLCPDSPALELAVRAMATVAGDLNALAAAGNNLESEDVTRAIMGAAGRLESACDLVYAVRATFGDGATAIDEIRRRRSAHS